MIMMILCLMWFFFNHDDVVMKIYIVMLLISMSFITKEETSDYKRYSLQAELVGVGEGRKLSCLSPIGGNQDFDHRTDHHNHHSGLNYFIIMGHLFVSFVDNLVMLIAKTVQEESSGQFGKKRSIIHQSSFSADKPIHCHNC